MLCLRRMCFLFPISLISSFLMFLSPLLFLIQIGFQTLLSLLPSSFTPTSSTPTSSSSLPSSLDCLSLDLFQSCTPISCVLDPPLESPSSFASPSLLYNPTINLDLPSSSSSSSLDVSIPVNTHLMLTRSKLGFHKPKVL